MSRDTRSQLDCELDVVGPLELLEEHVEEHEEELEVEHENVEQVVCIQV